MRADQIPTLDELELVAVVELALGQTTRSPHQQDRLLQVCWRMDVWSEPFRSWTAEAESTWAAVPCLDCGAAMPVAEHKLRCVVCWAEPPCMSEASS